MSVSPRLWLGYENASGLGVRARWWIYDNHAATGFLAMTLEDNPNRDFDTFYEARDVELMTVEVCVEFLDRQLRRAKRIRFGEASRRREVVDVTAAIELEANAR